ncbi:MAG TPA: response regulator [Candidatus Saccharibacteria bacterium]|nr:response regulator [Candidatus Saccharibacteria bacterium]
MKKTVMVVDDDPQIRELYEISLKLKGYEVVVAPDGEKALEMLRTNKAKPDLILLDVMMPKIHGLDVLNMIKTDPKISDIKVITFTALSDDVIRDKAMKYGAYSYIVKSELSMSDIMDKVEEAVKS